MIPLIVLSVFLITFFPIHGATPEIIFSTSAAALNKVGAVGAIRLNQQFANSTILNDYTGTEGTVQYKIHNSTYKQDLIMPQQIQMFIYDGRSDTEMKWVNLSGSAIMNIDYEISTVKGTSQVKVSYADGYAQVSFTMLKNQDGRPYAIEIGDLVLAKEKISVSFNGSETDDIKNLLTPILVDKALIEFKTYMQKAIENEGNNLNQQLAQMPMDLRLYKSVYEHFSLFDDPIAQSNYYITKMDAFAFSINQTAPNITVESKPLPLFDPNNGKDIHMFISEALFQNILDTKYAAGELSHKYVTSFLGRIIGMNCYATRSPNFVIMNKLNVDGSGQCNLTYQGPNNQYALAIAFDLNYEMNLTIVNSTLYLTINNQASGLSNVRILGPTPSELLWLAKIFNTLFGAVTNVINSILGTNGINLAKLFPGPILNIERYPKENHVAIYFNIGSF